VLAHAEFQAGKATTQFIAEQMGGWGTANEVPAAALIAAAVAEHLGLMGGAAPGGSANGAAQVDEGDRFSPWGRGDGFRVGGGAFGQG
jgi:hypothetical protein